MARALSQRDYERKLAHAQKQIEEKMSALKRTVTSLHFWQRRVNYYASQAALTDEQRETRRVEQRQRNEERRRRRAGRKVVL